MSRAAAILEYLPGPVRVLMIRLRRFSREDPAANTSAVPKAIDLKGSLVADAMMKGVNEENDKTLIQERNKTYLLNTVSEGRKFICEKLHLGSMSKIRKVGVSLRFCRCHHVTRIISPLSTWKVYSENPDFFKPKVRSNRASATGF